MIFRNYFNSSCFVFWGGKFLSDKLFLHRNVFLKKYVCLWPKGGIYARSITAWEATSVGKSLRSIGEVSSTFFPLNFLKKIFMIVQSRIMNQVRATSCNKTVLHQRFPSSACFYCFTIKHGNATTECSNKAFLSAQFPQGCFFSLPLPFFWFLGIPFWGGGERRFWVSWSFTVLVTRFI